MTRTFDHLFVIGRPASGKSEFSDFMINTPDDERASYYHIGKFEEMDDFPWLWEKFLEDDMWEEAGYPRVFSAKSNGNYNVLPEKYNLYDMMFHKFNHEIAKRYLSRPDFYETGTLFVEFSRGREGAYKNAFQRLSKEVLNKSAILYLNVDFEESWRRNVARYEEKLKHSKLAHIVPRPTMENMYGIDDWAEFTGGREYGTFSVHGLKVPFLTMMNTPELKERGPLSKRYRPSLDKLMELYTGAAG